MSDDIWFYRYMDEFPQPPQEFIDRALTMAHNFMENPPFENAYHAQKLPGYGREIVLEDGTESTSRMTPRWELGEDFSQWVIENIYPNPVDSALSLSMGMGPVTGLHLDGSRHFTYAYLLEVSNPGQITKWWQEHGHPIQRRETQYYLADWNNVELLEEVELELGRWVALNIGIVHSVHNIQGNLNRQGILGYRNQIQISLPQDPFSGKSIRGLDKYPVDTSQKS